MNVINHISTWSIGVINGYKGVAPDIKYYLLPTSVAINTATIFAKAPKHHPAATLTAAFLVTGANYWLGDLVGSALAKN